MLFAMVLFMKDTFKYQIVISFILIIFLFGNGLYFDTLNHTNIQLLQEVSSISSIAPFQNTTVCSTCPSLIYSGENIISDSSCTRATSVRLRLFNNLLSLFILLPINGFEKQRLFTIYHLSLRQDSLYIIHFIHNLDGRKHL